MIVQTTDVKKFKEKVLKSWLGNALVRRFAVAVSLVQKTWLQIAST